MDDESEKEGVPNKSEEKSAETDRSTGTRKQKHRGWIVGTGGDPEVSRRKTGKGR